MHFTTLKNLAILSFLSISSVSASILAKRQTPCFGTCVSITVLDETIPVTTCPTGTICTGVTTENVTTPLGTLGFSTGVRPRAISLDQSD